MSEVKKIATRESYGNALVELGKAHEDVVVPVSYTHLDIQGRRETFQEGAEGKEGEAEISFGCL